MRDGEGDKFIKAIEALSANGGGDCPELTFTGIINAFNEGVDGETGGASLYVFTDASAKDATPENQELAKVMAKSKGANVYFFITGLCGMTSYKPFDDLAASTCGQVFELPKDASELAKMKKVTKSLLGGTTCAGDSGGNPAGPVLGRKKRSATIEYSLIVDDTMERIIVTVATQNRGSTINLKDPRGLLVLSGKTLLSKGALFEVDHPTPGIWKLSVSSGAGKHSYLIKGSSHTNVDFDFIFIIPRKGMSPLPIPHPLIGELCPHRLVSYYISCTLKGRAHKGTSPCDWTMRHVP